MRALLQVGCTATRSELRTGIAAALPAHKVVVGMEHGATLRKDENASGRNKKAKPWALENLHALLTILLEIYDTFLVNF